MNTGKQTTYGLEFSFENKINEFIKLHFNLSIVNGYLDYIESETLKNQTGGNTVQIYNNGAFLEYCYPDSGSNPKTEYRKD